MAKEELADLYNEFNYKIWRNNRYPKRGKRPYLTHP
jgi:hypothetical protein